MSNLRYNRKVITYECFRSQVESGTCDLHWILTSHLILVVLKVNVNELDFAILQCICTSKYHVMHDKNMQCYLSAWKIMKSVSSGFINKIITRKSLKIYSNAQSCFFFKFVSKCCHSVLSLVLWLFFKSWDKNILYFSCDLSPSSHVQSEEKENRKPGGCEELRLSFCSLMKAGINYRRAACFYYHVKTCMDNATVPCSQGSLSASFLTQTFYF